MNFYLTTLFVDGTTWRGGIMNWKRHGRKRSWPNLKLSVCLGNLKKTAKYISPFVRLQGKICNRYVANMAPECNPLDGDFRFCGRTFLIEQKMQILRSNVIVQIWPPLFCDIRCHICFTVSCVQSCAM